MDPTHQDFPLKELRIVVLHNQDFLHASPDNVSLASRADVVQVAQEVALALAARGHFVQVQGIDTSDLPNLLQQFQSDPPDLVFNLCESLGEDDRHEALVPALLDLLGIAYTGSDSLALGLALRKERTRDILRSAGIQVPAAVVLPATSQFPEQDLFHLRSQQLAYPLIVKPTRENASVGIHQDSVVYTDENLLQKVNTLRALYQQPILVEEYILGREINVSFLENHGMQILPLHEIDFSSLPKEFPHIVSYDGKWNKDSLEYKHTMPQPISDLPQEQCHRIQEIARAAFAALEIHDYGRCDLRLDTQGQVYLIDVNPNCDLARDAGFAKAATHAMLTYEDLIECIALGALKRSHHVSFNKQSTVLTNVQPGQTRSSFRSDELISAASQRQSVYSS